jgi:tetratricopeptide (TPR) repeat protein
LTKPADLYIKEAMPNKINISPRKQKLIVYIFLIVVTLAVFWQVNQYSFVNIDDVIYVTENIHIQSGITLNGLCWAFNTTDAEFWHPLTWISLMFDYQLYGLDAGGYHLTNLILHILSTLLLFRLFNRMTGMVWRSAFVAALFALHPLHVESVAWIAERKDVLSAFLFMLTLCIYVYYTEKPVIGRYLLVLFFFVLALMSKPMVVTLPVIMILLDYWPLGRFESKEDNLITWQLKEKAPFFVLSVVFSIITLYAQYKPSVKRFPFLLGPRIGNALFSFGTYLKKIFWPLDLVVFYPFSYQLTIWQVLGASLLIIVISVAVIVMAKRFPHLFVGWLWYGITLLPVIGIIQIGSQAMADRYTYLPLIGIGIILAWGMPLLFQHECIRKKILFPAGIAVLIILSVLTWQQCGYWKNSITLFSHALQINNDNYLAHGNFGFALFEEGKSEEAIDHYNKAMRMILNPASVYSNRGNAYAKLGQYQRAFDDYNEAIRLEPDYADAYYNRGNIYREFGQYQKAVKDYNESIHLKKDNIRAYYNRGIAYTKLGYYQLAIDDFTKATDIKQDFANAYNSRGAVYLHQGNRKAGCWDAQKACELGNCEILEVAKYKRDCR